jgi:hypothetical protein
MGAALKLTPGQLRDLAQALDMLAEITKQTGVQFCVYDRLTVEIGDSTLKIQDKDGTYVVEDYIGD